MLGPLERALLVEVRRAIITLLRALDRYLEATKADSDK